jgi:hypothetical protein
VFVYNNRCKYIIIASALLLILVSCSEFTIEKPEGFAEVVVDYYDRGEILFKAISPEGLLFKVKKVENYPRMQLEFWGEALSNQLQKEGYTLIGEEQRFRAGKNEGVYFKWGVPYGNDSYIYLTSLLVYDDEILITEAAGEQSLFNDYEDTIILSMQSISYK